MIESHQAVLHGDLYACGDMFILRYCSSPIFVYDQQRIDNALVSFFNNACDAADNQMPWTLPDNLNLDGACVWIIHKDYVRLSASLSEQMAIAAAYQGYFLDKDDQFHD